MNNSSIDIKSVTTSRLVMRFGDKDLALGTGFFYRHKSSNYLITNWHNVAGRDPQSLEPKGGHSGLPDNINLSLNKKDELGSWVEKNIPLYEDDEKTQPCWFVHPNYNHSVDLVAIPIKEDFNSGSIYPVNDKKISKTPDMRISTGQDVFVLGYPKGLSGGGLFPIWKRATVATEPAVDIDGAPKLLIDTATREGMSGAPVFATSQGMYQTPDTLSISPGGGIRFLGIYSGRNIGKTEIEAQLGFVWKEKAIKSTIERKKRGESSFQIN